jgi:hypothetical protein
MKPKRQRIPNLITPFQDELTYSIIARVRWLMRFGSVENVAEHFFGGKVGIKVKDLTPRLGDLHRIEGEDADPLAFIRKHTLLPIYAPFLAPKSLSAMESRLKSGTATGVHARAGVQNSLGGRPEYLRFCPCCATEERAKMGEAYWHRLHQVSGVLVCPVHKVFLQESDVKMSSQLQDSKRLFAAEDVIQSLPPVAIDLASLDHQTLLRLAQSAEDLLSNSYGGDGFDRLRQRYRSLASENGYLTIGGRILTRKLLEDFYTRFHHSLLESLSPALAASCEYWVPRMFLNATNVQPPLRHMLLMDFFRITPQRFFKLSGVIVGILGSGPWRCSNPLCPKAGRKVIREIRYARSSKTKRIVGILICPTCGQRIRRSLIDGREHETVLNQGPLWERELGKLWEDRSLSLAAISAQLKSDPDTVLMYAAKQGLWFSPKIRAYFSGRNKAKFNFKRGLRFQRRMKKHRATWLEQRKKYPDKTISELRLRANTCYRFLSLHDRAWLRKNSPAARQRQYPGGRRVDWKKRDRQFAASIKQAKNQMMRAQTVPERIRRRALLAQAGDPNGIRCNWKRLPLTHLALDSLAEGRLEFLLRSIAWLASELRRQKGGVDQRELVRCVRSHHPGYRDLIYHQDVISAIRAEVVNNAEF